MSRDEFVEDILNLPKVPSKLSDRTKKFNGFLLKYDRLYSELQIKRKCNSHSVTGLFSWKKLWSKPCSRKSWWQILEENVYKDFSLTAVNVTLEELHLLHLCHRLKKRSRGTVKFKCRKRRQNVICNRDNLKNKSSDLTQLKLSGKVFISGSMSYENHQLAYRYVIN